VRPTSDRGSASLELVLLTPVLVALLLFAVLAGRLSQTRADVDRAARDAARSASLARSSENAATDGEAAARATLTDGGVSCAHLEVDIDTSRFAAGGTVAATVTCTVALTDLSLLGVPGSRTLSASFVQPIDTYRGLAP